MGNLKTKWKKVKSRSRAAFNRLRGADGNTIVEEVEPGESSGSQPPAYAQSPTSSQQQRQIQNSPGPPVYSPLGQASGGPASPSSSASPPYYQSFDFSGGAQPQTPSESPVEHQQDTPASSQSAASPQSVAAPQPAAALQPAAEVAETVSYGPQSAEGDQPGAHEDKGKGKEEESTSADEDEEAVDDHSDDVDEDEEEPRKKDKGKQPMRYDDSSFSGKMRGGGDTAADESSAISLSQGHEKDFCLAPDNEAGDKTAGGDFQTTLTMEQRAEECCAGKLDIDLPPAREQTNAPAITYSTGLQKEPDCVYPDDELAAGHAVSITQLQKSMLGTRIIKDGFPKVGEPTNPGKRRLRLKGPPRQRVKNYENVKKTGTQIDAETALPKNQTAGESLYALGGSADEPLLATASFFRENSYVNTLFSSLTDSVDSVNLTACFPKCTSCKENDDVLNSSTREAKYENHVGCLGAGRTSTHICHDREATMSVRSVTSTNKPSQPLQIYNSMRCRDPPNLGTELRGSCNPSKASISKSTRELDTDLTVSASKPYHCPEENDHLHSQNKHPGAGDDEGLDPEKESRKSFDSESSLSWLEKAIMVEYNKDTNTGKYTHRSLRQALQDAVAGTMSSFTQRSFKFGGKKKLKRNPIPFGAV